jgi:hypothetical protein
VCVLQKNRNERGRYILVTEFVEQRSKWIISEGHKLRG